MKNRPWRVLIALIILVSLACNLPVEQLAGQAGSAVTPPAGIYLPDEQGGGNPETAQPAGGSIDEPCGYQWASNPLPDISEEIQNMFDEAGLADLQVTAEAFGENCIRADGSIARFLTMQTDIRVIVAVEQVQDLAPLGEIAREILRILVNIPREQLAGPNDGYIGIQFTSQAGDILSLWFSKARAVEALQQDLDGAALVEALRNP